MLRGQLVKEHLLVRVVLRDADILNQQVCSEFGKLFELECAVALLNSKCC